MAAPCEVGESGIPCVEPLTQLSFVVHDVSSFCGDFSPRHILVDKPSDQKSRWLSDGNKPPQYVLLKLSRPAIVRKILFGKYEQSHPCNIQKLRIYGGLDPDHTHLLLEGGLKNNSIPEMLDLQCVVDGQPFPCQYIKIVPLQSWGGTFNFSIWYTQLWGVCEEGQVESAMTNLMQYREREAVRLCLKHLRQYDYSDAFEALQKRSKILLEHPLLSMLYQKLVTEGDFQEAESIICRAMEEGFFDSYVTQQPVKAGWKSISLLADEKSQNHLAKTPDMRGGHQMCLDSAAGELYLHGGWGGNRELADFWKFSIHKHQWTCISLDTANEGGPGARSCHAMCLDSQHRGLYVLGGCDMEAVSTNPSSLPSDFYFYSFDTEKWQLLCPDTCKVGGPRLVYDHQMCYDSTSGLLYVLGGKIVSTDLSGGLYAYHTVEHHWLSLLPDQSIGPIQQPFLPRSGHVMLFHPTLHQLFVLGGQRQQEILGDMMTYNVRSGEISVLANVPVASFTLRAALDISKNQICVLSGLNRSTDLGEAKRSDIILWLYDIPSDRWSRVVRDDKVPMCNVPVPRYGHSFVHDSLHHIFYMFGGNAGSDNHSKTLSTMRLDDFWELELENQTKEKLLRECQLSLRKRRYIELCASAPTEAVAYLKTSVAALVNHSDQDESQQYRELTGALFGPDTIHPENTLFQRRRNELYNEVVTYFPSHMSQPKDNLTDFIGLDYMYHHH